MCGSGLAQALHSLQEVYQQAGTFIARGEAGMIIANARTMPWGGGRGARPDVGVYIPESKRISQQSWYTSESTASYTVHYILYTSLPTKLGYNYI